MLNNYFNYTQQPWGKLFYRVIFKQLSHIKNCNILDFGSGFGITANQLATHNTVLAIEPNQEMINMRSEKHQYAQMCGDIKSLSQLESATFDVIICHNVLEYADERQQLLEEFCRLLKPNGTLSIVKHNHAGRIMQKAIFENNLDEALNLQRGGTLSTVNFGDIFYYNTNDLLQWSNSQLSVDRILGVRIFWGLVQNNEIKHDPEWQSKIFELEMSVCDQPDYYNISFFHHILLKKVSA